MAEPKKQLDRLFEEIDRTPWGPQERALVAEAVALAQEIGDEQLEYHARMRQTASANMGGLTDLMLSSFAWCLAHHDADPARFPADIDNGAADLMWQFKWMASSLRSSPAFAPEQVAAVLDDMEAHYRAAGLGMSGVLMARFEDAHAAGRMDEAERLRVQLEATPRDSHSHCDACGRSQVAGFFADTDRDEEAIRLVEEMLEGGFSCGEEPEHALSVSLLPYLRLGRGEQARAAHLRSYRLAKDNPDLLTAIANSIRFCSVSGNEARALTLIERHLPWLAHDALNAQGHFRMLTALGTALDAVTAAGHGATPIRGADSPDLEPFFGAPDGTDGGAWSAAGLATAAWAAAERIGMRFDERDGTDNHAQRLRLARRTATERYDVPIRSDVFAAPPVDAVPTDDEGWYRRVLDLAGYGAAADTLDALAHVIDRVDPERRAVLTGQRLAALVNLDRIDEATALLPDRLRALRAAGLDAQAAVEERFGLALFGTATDADNAALADLFAASADPAGPHALPPATRGDIALTLAFDLGDDPAAALALAEQAAALFAEAGDARLGHGAEIAAAMALLRADRGDEALARIDALLADAAITRGVRARMLETRARVQGGRGAFAEGAADADEAGRILAELGSLTPLAGAQMLAGALWEDAEEPEQALTRYRVGARLLEQRGGDVAGAKYRAARSMLNSGAVEEAAELFGEVLQLEEADEVPAGSRAMTALMLARALRAAGEGGQAYGAFGYAAELFGEAENPADQALALMNRAQILAQYDEREQAVETLEEAAAIVRTADDAPAAVVEVLHNLGQSYGAQQDPRAFALFDEVEAVARANDADWVIADVTDSRARALLSSERVDEGVAAALTASDAFAAVGDAQSAGGSALLAARALTGGGRAADAVAAYRAVLDQAAEIPPLRQIAALELGDVLQGLGRDGEAAKVRRLAEE
ncbi:hypothetical protein LXM50_05975 [Microbacterium sp. Au-Mic1]|uniref:hypothetical protein n=1 Tax=Microbacterium sp. Au-Mic1 TaxID=2906457 RepID=UPI001E4A5831|nr:hypothetical protein [Microbacterium sp. Au-Mic1]MCE4025515.1 hypothetical protein [Microbacterium sp. Au-Mic1]